MESKINEKQINISDSPKFCCDIEKTSQKSIVCVVKKARRPPLRTRLRQRGVARKSPISPTCKSCLRDGTSKTKDKSVSTMDAPITIFDIDENVCCYQIPLEPATYPTSDDADSSHQPAPKSFYARQEIAESEAVACHRAKVLRQDVAGDCSVKPVILWSDGLAYLVTNNASSVYFDRKFADGKILTEDAEVLTRDVALELSAGCWEAFNHFGDSPTTEDRIQRQLAPVLPKPCKELPSPSKYMTEIPLPDVLPEHVDYVFIEYCCTPTSRLCDAKFVKNGMENALLIRLTEDIDMTSPRGLRYARAIVDKYQSCKIFLWGSLPCTAGSPWQYINRHKVGFQRRHNKQMATFRMLMQNFTTLAEDVRSYNGNIAFEWPKTCRLWKHAFTVKLMELLQMEKVHFNGCKVGLLSTKGNPIFKPWTIATDSKFLHKTFQNRRCTKADNHNHDICQGPETARTGNYTDEMAYMVHQAFNRQLMYDNSDPRFRKEPVTPDGHPCCCINPKRAENASKPTSICAVKSTPVHIFDVADTWTVDTGAPVDVTTAALAGHLSSQFVPMKYLDFETAGGETSSAVGVELSFKIGDKSHISIPYLLQDTPSVLSVGLRVKEQGFAFIWLPGKKPCLVDNNGRILPLLDDDGTPVYDANSPLSEIRDPEELRELCGVIVSDGVLRIAHQGFAKSRRLKTLPAKPTTSSAHDDHSKAGAVTSTDELTLKQVAKLKPGQSSVPSDVPVTETLAIEDAKTKKGGLKAKSSGEAPDETSPHVVSDDGERIDTKPLKKKGVSARLHEADVMDSDGGSTEAGESGGEETADESSEDEDQPIARRSLWDVANSVDHWLTHKPGLPKHCEDCLRAKTRRMRRTAKKESRSPKKFGDLITCDHVLMKDWLGYKGVDGIPDLLNVFDLATRCKYAIPTDSADSLDTYTALNFVKGKSPVNTLYSDNWGAFKKAAKQLKFNWEPCQPGVHKSNAVIERCNEDIIYGLRTLLTQAGLPACFWPYAAPCYTHHENISVDEDTGVSPWSLRHGSEFKGQAIPFGCGVWYLPAPTKGMNSKAAPTLSYGVFLGYRLTPGGGWNNSTWSPLLTILLMEISTSMLPVRDGESIHTTPNRLNLENAVFTFLLKLSMRRSTQP